MQAYQAGQYDMARMFFTKALQDALLKGNEEWVAKAALNLADLELEAMQEAEAARILERVTTRDPALRGLVLWKRSQLAFQQRRHAQAVGLADSALRLAGKDKARETALRLDRLRYLIAWKEPGEWDKEYEDAMRRLPGADRGRVASLEASAAMARKDFARADTLWREATSWYRDNGRLAKVAACLNQGALAQFSLGNREDALDMNARAVAVYAELGLAMPGLKAQALRLILVDDDRELARLREEVDLLGQRLSGFDLQEVLDGYSQSLPDSPSLRPAP